MNWRTTLVLAAIALGAFVYLRFFELKQPGTEEARRQAQNVVNFDRDKIDAIVILNGDEKIELRRRDNRWRLETPIKDQADSSLIENLLRDLGDWQKEGTISAKEIDADKSKLTEYGLNKPKLRLKLIGEDKPPPILFGKDAALEGKMYVRFENSKETYLAGQSIKKEIDKKPEEFRDRKLMDLTTAQVSRVVLKTPTGEIELQKKGDHWEILKPLRAPGDDEKIGEVYVRFAPRGFVYTLPKKIEEILKTKPDDLRDRHLVRIDTNVLDRITIDAPGKGKTRGALCDRHIWKGGWR